MNRREGEIVGRWIGGLIRLERLAAAGLLVAVLSVMAAQVAARYLFRAPIPWSEEAARFALIWLSFVAASFVMAEGRHITVDLISARLGRTGRVALECLSGGLVAVSCLLLMIGGLPFVLRVAPVGSPALGIPMSWWYAAAAVGLGLMALHSLLNVVYALRVGRPVWDEPPPGEGELGPESGGAV